jgi:hypothetical protein
MKLKQLVERICLWSGEKGGIFYGMWFYIAGVVAFTVLVLYLSKY